MNKFEKAYLSIISESKKSLVKEGPITRKSVLETDKADIENELYGKTYAELTEVAKHIAKNVAEDVNNKYANLTCPVCGKPVTKESGRQWGHVKTGSIRKDKAGLNLKERDCAIKWSDALRALDKQYPDDKGAAVERLKMLSK